MDPIRRRRRLTWVLGSIVLLGLGVIIGLILENVWLGVTLAVIVSIGWIIAVESARGGNRGIHDDDHGIEL
ncbi:hypothetical protein [Microbacterium gorillae]|uniref:hypothetical protein n=1 Tax=Microbacterium gorillae TaxID=1231063 RepID=UPI00058EFF67|nr:hypothetical protein [Microbacterium gorillae]